MYTNREEKNGITMLESDILHALDFAGEDTRLIIAGDFNARTGVEIDYISCDDATYLPCGETYDCDDFVMHRNSKDNVIVNNFGRSVIDLCKCLNIHIVNGRCSEDILGDYTYLSSSGQSVIDYFIVSTQLFTYITHFEVLNNDLSDHFAVVCSFDIPVASGTTDLPPCTPWSRCRWRVEGESLFLENLMFLIHEGGLFDCNNIVDINLNEAADNLSSVLLDAGKHMVTRTRKYTCKQPAWWNTECSELKARKYIALQNFRRSDSSRDKELYLTSRRVFKRFCSSKKRDFENSVKDHVISSDMTTQQLWQSVKGFMRCKNQSNNISVDMWLSHFKQLLNSNNFPTDAEFEEEAISAVQNCDTTSNHNDMLDGDITLDELTEAVYSMNSGKAPGPDGIVVEMLKSSLHILHPYILVLFNAILQTGEFPSAWTRAVICPLYKSGNKNEVSNYRGISLLDILGKIFTKILNNRLNRYAGESGKLFEEQAGYRKGYSTIDNIFILQAAVQKYITKKKGRMYCLFVDFSKAFDSVQHSLLYFVLLKNGIDGKLFAVLKSMYSQLKACVKSMEGLTEYFSCNIGTRQGCLVSPILFVFFLNEYVTMVKNANCGGIQIDNVTELLTLLYADDLADLADTVRRLQKQIHVLENFCSLYGMGVNLDKTKILVFRRGGVLNNTEKWFLSGHEIEIVNKYKYLGIWFTTKLSWWKTRQHLSEQAKKASYSLLRFIRKYKVNTKLALFLFDRMVAPILFYGAEVWGFERVECIENIQIQFCKKLVGVSSNVTNQAVLGELGRFSLSIGYMKRCVLYWLKLTNMEPHRYPRKCYNMLFQLDGVDRNTWVTQVKRLLFVYGFHDVWNAQGVGDMRVFISVLNQRLRQNAREFWLNSLESNGKMELYLQFKYEIEPERYLLYIHNKQFGRALFLLRCSAHKLAVETGRWYFVPREERYCVACKKILNILVVEDEHHFIFDCFLYNGIRQKYLSESISKYNSVKQIMCLCGTDEAWKLGAYAYEGFKIRNQNLNVT